MIIFLLNCIDFGVQKEQSWATMFVNVTYFRISAVLSIEHEMVDIAFDCLGYFQLGFLNRGVFKHSKMLNDDQSVVRDSN